MLILTSLITVCLALVVVSVLYPQLKQVSIFLFFLSLFIISSLRDYVGVDYASYVSLFHMISNGQSSYTEPGFNLVVKLIYDLGFSYQTVFAFFSFFTLFFYIRTLSRYSVAPLLSLLLFLMLPFCFLATLNQIRQFLAVSLVFYSMRFIMERSFLKFLLIVIVASFFHKTAIIFIPLYWLIIRNFSIGFSFIVIAVAVVFAKYFESFIITGLFSNSYFNADNGGSALISFFYFFIFLFLFIIMKIVKPPVFVNSIFNGDMYRNVITNSMLFCSFIFLLASLVQVVSPSNIIRLTSYFSIYICFAIPYLVSSICSKDNFRVFFVYIILVFVLLNCFNLIVFKGERYKLVPFNMSMDKFYD